MKHLSNAVTKGDVPRTGRVLDFIAFWRPDQGELFPCHKMKVCAELANESVARTRPILHTFDLGPEGVFLLLGQEFFGVQAGPLSCCAAQL